MLSDGAVSWTVELQTKVHIKVPTTALTLKTSWTQFHIYSFLALCLNRILNVKVIVAAFKQEKALVLGRCLVPLTPIFFYGNENLCKYDV